MIHSRQSGRIRHHGQARDHAGQRREEAGLLQPDVVVLPWDTTRIAGQSGNVQRQPAMRGVLLYSQRRESAVLEKGLPNGVRARDQVVEWSSGEVTDEGIEESRIPGFG